VPTYLDTLEYLFSLHRFGVKLGLEAITDILQRLENPHRRYATLHIAGTNGKGSTAAMLAAMLQGGGYRVGLYTSPHLMDFRERIRVQDEDISEACVCELTDRIRRAAHPLSPLTFFELVTAMAFQHFLDQQVDIVIVEVGMGGRFDATNVLDPLGVLITGIGLDHETYLGQSIQAIAREKAGIIRQPAPIVLGPMPEGVKEIFENKARSYHAPLYRFGLEFSLLETSSREFSYYGPKWTLPGIQTCLRGRHQMENAANALALLESAVQDHFPLSPEAIQLGLQHVRWKGRLELIQRDPIIILDGAHNPLGARVLFDFLQSQIHDCPGRRLIMVVGMMGDKNHREFLSVLLPIMDGLILTQARMARAASVDDLKKGVNRKDLHCLNIADSWEALGKAKEMANSSDLICVTGSLFLVGEILKHFSRSVSPTIQL